MKERIMFLLQMIRNNKINASITPSSRFLAKQMIKGIDWKSIDTIIELGPGTGIFTKHIIDNIKVGTKIIVVEIEDIYVTHLKEKFGDKIIIEKSDVKNIDEIRKKYNIKKIDLIVSGLPFIPAESIHDKLKIYTSQGTIFRSFTYHPKKFRNIYAEFPVNEVGFSLVNIPPARVYGIN
ncbi:hypothetical protein K9M48_04245 [Candidatus Gracilibacteria bacterium]|nr:hypothetical protein [Candidatus Gracilibacteria bacterium]